MAAASVGAPRTWWASSLSLRQGCVSLSSRRSVAQQSSGGSVSALRIKAPSGGCDSTAASALARSAGSMRELDPDAEAARLVDARPLLCLMLPGPPLWPLPPLKLLLLLLQLPPPPLLPLTKW